MLVGQRAPPRESWDAIIEREIEAASAIVVIWTPRPVASEWVKIEANYAKRHGKLVPLMAEACAIPLAFSLTQAAELTDWKGSGEHEEWQKALGWIGALIGAALQAMGAGGGRRHPDGSAHPARAAAASAQSVTLGLG